jgi:limonene-1,2-epoxide hydrolase
LTPAAQRLRSSAEVATAFFAAINAHDLDRACQFLADDVAYSNGIGFAELRGIAQFRYIWAPVLSGPATRLEIRTVIAGEHTVAIEREDVQRRTGPDGTEREIRLPGVACLDINTEGKITAWRDYYDMEAWCRLLGRPYDHFRTWFQLASQI